jgi:hypothetical protein
MSQWSRWSGFEGERLRAFSSNVDAIFRSIFDEGLRGLEYSASLEDVRVDRWDVPGRTYVWRAPLPDVSWRSVQYQLLSSSRSQYALLGGSAWLDVGGTSDARRTRLWCHTPSRRRAPWHVGLGFAPSHDFGGEAASERVAAALVEVAMRVVRWRFVDERSAWVGDDVVPEEPVSFPAPNVTGLDA